MPERHLTDNEIMGIMDGGNEFQDQFIMEHLGICTKCQKSLELYQTLYHELQNTKGFDIPADFTESVMAQVLTVEKTKAPNREFSLIWIISGVITFLGISW
ncbi:MAG: hypothetical protein NTV06_00975, partial [candidate division Zixibacteria bacterium]|nr:hypothetical protein [candidate division Zixibacteria bacterium]